MGCGWGRMSFWLIEHSFGLSRFPAAGLFIAGCVCQENTSPTIPTTYYAQILRDFLYEVLFAWPYDFMLAPQ